MAEITAEKGPLITKIFFNGLLHLRIVRTDLALIHSKNTNGKYLIELYFKQTPPVLLEYTDIDKWVTILKILNENL